jgi:hypothetical protein
LGSHIFKVFEILVFRILLFLFDLRLESMKLLELTLIVLLLLHHEFVMACELETVLFLIVDAQVTVAEGLLQLGNVLFNLC